MVAAGVAMGAALKPLRDCLSPADIDPGDGEELEAGNNYASARIDELHRIGRLREPDKKNEPDDEF
jgi:hypothetical protein